MAGQAGSQGNKARPGNRRVAQWTRGYARLPGIPDEYLTEDGTPREVWTRFFEAFAELTPRAAMETRIRSSSFMALLYRTRATEIARIAQVSRRGERNQLAGTQHDDPPLLINVPATGLRRT